MFGALAELALLREVVGPLLLNVLLSILPRYTSQVLNNSVLNLDVLHFEFKEDCPTELAPKITTKRSSAH